MIKKGINITMIRLIIVMVGFITIYFSIKGFITNDHAHNLIPNNPLFIEEILFYVCIPGYLLGSIPSGIIITKILGLGSLRTIGSGNIGATNVLRTGSKLAAALTFLCDALKGIAAVLYIKFLPATLQHPCLPYFAAMAALYGHMAPVWLRFRGGKGIASIAGILLILNPYVGTVFVISWLVVALVTHLSSLAALLAVTIVPIAAYILDDKLLLYWLGCTVPFIIYKHSENIDRLLSGKEYRIA